MTGIFCYALDFYDLYAGQPVYGWSCTRSGVGLCRWSFGLGFIILFPHGVKGGILAYCYAFSAMIVCGLSIPVGAPALKIVVSSGGFRTTYSKGSCFATFYLLCLRLRCAGALVSIIAEGNILETILVIAQIQDERVRRVSGMGRSWSSPCSGGCAHISIIYVGG